MFQCAFWKLTFFIVMFLSHFVFCFAFILKTHYVLGSKQIVWSFLFSVYDEFEVNKQEPAVPLGCRMGWEWYLSLVDIMILLWIQYKSIKYVIECTFYHFLYTDTSVIKQQFQHCLPHFFSISNQEYIMQIVTLNIPLQLQITS